MSANFMCNINDYTTPASFKDLQIDFQNQWNQMTALDVNF